MIRANAKGLKGGKAPSQGGNEAGSLHFFHPSWAKKTLTGLGANVMVAQKRGINHAGRGFPLPTEFTPKSPTRGREEVKRLYQTQVVQGFWV